MLQYFSKRNSRSMKEWILYLEKNKPQGNALVGGLVIMMFSGQQLSWGIFNHNFGSHFVNSVPSNMTFWMFWIISSWFMAAVVGGFIAAKLLQNIRKIKVYVSLIINRF